jgi:hypothetical protein
MSNPPRVVQQKSTAFALIRALDHYRQPPVYNFYYQAFDQDYQP